ncbi:MAG: DUF4153 domain-containing protein [Gemmatimonadales bacterium]
MRLPSIDAVVTTAVRTARRFPLVLASAALATAAALETTRTGSGPEPTRLLLAASLGLPLFFALTVLAERYPASSPQRWAIPSAGIFVLAAFWAMWTGWSSPVQTLRYVQLSVAFHLFAAFAPYTGSNRPGGFWQYNRILFLRFLTAYLYTVVLYGGIAIALLAVDKLFSVPIHGENYLRLFIVIAFLFNTWFFLGGIPENLESLDERPDYPAGLRVFTQYVLVPIVVLYLAILTVYLAKVVFTREWPNGWIGYLVSSVAVVGLLSWLLIHPLEERAEYAWVKGFTRGFYIALMPAIVMLWLAIYKRVSEYGVTEPRYFLVVLSVWLAGIAVWYTATRSRNIKIIPASLCALAVITFAGPTGAYSVSQASQERRLERILAQDGVLENGHVRISARDVPFRDRREISGTLRYLLASHGPGAIGAWLPDSVRRVLPVAPARYGSDGEARTVMASLHVEYVAPNEVMGGGDYFGLNTGSPHDAIAISGYTYAIRLSYWNINDSLKVGDDYMLRWAADSTALELSRGGTVALSIPLEPVADSGLAFRRARGGGVTIPQETLRVEAGDSTAAALLYLTMLAGHSRPGGAKLNSLAGTLFLRVR